MNPPLMDVTLVKAAGPGDRDRAWLTVAGVTRRGPVHVVHDLPHLAVESLFGIAPRECRGHRRRFLPDARSQSQERNHPEQDLINPRGGDFYLATSGDRNLAVDTSCRLSTASATMTNRARHPAGTPAGRAGHGGIPASSA